MNLDISPASIETSSDSDTIAWHFDHVNVSMGANHALSQLFEGVMGMHVGPRPPFPFPGQWLYEGEQAMVHAVNDAGLSAKAGELRFGHVAFRSELPASQLLERLNRSALSFKVARIPEDHVAQIFVLLPGDFVVELDVPDDLIADVDHRYTETQTAPNGSNF